MVGSFAIRYFCGRFLDRKMVAWMIGEVYSLSFFVGGFFNLLEVRDSERSVDLKSMGKGAQKCAKYNKERWWY